MRRNTSALAQAAIYEAQQHFTTLDRHQLQSYADLAWGILELMDELDETEEFLEGLDSALLGDADTDYGSGDEATSALGNAIDDEVLTEGGGLREVHGGAGSRPSVAMAIDFAVKGNMEDVEERRIFDVEERLMTLFALLYPAWIGHAPANACFVAARKLGNGDRVTIRFVDAFAVTAGYKRVEGMHWPTKNNVERVWEVRIVDTQIELVGVERKPRPPSCSVMAWHAMFVCFNACWYCEEVEAFEEVEPRDVVEIARYLEEKLKLRVDDEFIVEFSINHERKCLDIWSGTVHKYCTRRGRNLVSLDEGGVMVDIAPVRKVDAKKCAMEDIACYLVRGKYPAFWRWFITAALNGRIEGDVENSFRTSWFPMLRPWGVRLDVCSRFEVRDLEPFLGRAVWQSLTDSNCMSYRKSRNGMYLVGYLKRRLQDDEDYIVCEWSDIKVPRDGRRVNGFLKIGHVGG